MNKLQELEDLVNDFLVDLGYYAKINFKEEEYIPKLKTLRIDYEEKINDLESRVKDLELDVLDLYSTMNKYASLQTKFNNDIINLIQKIVLLKEGE